MEWKTKNKIPWDLDFIRESYLEFSIIIIIILLYY